jgi:hypothetical protein
VYCPGDIVFLNKKTIEFHPHSLAQLKIFVEVVYWEAKRLGIEVRQFISAESADLEFRAVERGIDVCFVKYTDTEINFPLVIACHGALFPWDKIKSNGNKIWLADELTAYGIPPVQRTGN